MRFVLGIVTLAMATVLTACTTSSTAPSSTAPFSSVDLTAGTGTAAATGNTLTVNYTGWIYDASKVDKKGLEFDTSIGKTAFTFTLGNGSVIAGWDQGLVGMKVGGIRRLVIPPSIGYGATRFNFIPPYATLVFDIELEDVQIP